MESDGIEEGMEGTSRVLVTSAAHVAAEIARELQRRAQERRDDALREVTQGQSREQAMWEQTRAQLAPVMEDRWWEQASPQNIVEAYEQARAFDHREDARPFAERIETQVRDRYGFNIDDVRQQAQQDANEQSADAAKDRAEAERLMADADRSDTRLEQQQDGGPEVPERAQEERQDASVLYDSAERREDLASDLRGRGVDSEAVEARVTADVGQAVPADEAARAPGRPSKARKGRGRGQGQRSRESQRG